MQKITFNCKAQWIHKINYNQKVSHKEKPEMQLSNVENQWGCLQLLYSQSNPAACFVNSCLQLVMGAIKEVAAKVSLEVKMTSAVVLMAILVSRRPKETIHTVNPFHPDCCRKTAVDLLMDSFYCFTHKIVFLHFSYQSITVGPPVPFNAIQYIGPE